MLWELLFQKVALAIGTLLALVPGAALVDFGSMTPVFSAMYTFDGIIPIHETLAYAASYIGFLSVIWIFIVTRAIMRWLPIFGIKG